MPWCDDCNRFWSHDAVSDRGECPTCRRVIVKERDVEDVGAPWHFKLLVAATVLYLAYRAYYGVVWLLEHA